MVNRYSRYSWLPNYVLNNTKEASPQRHSVNQKTYCYGVNEMNCSSDALGKFTTVKPKNIAKQQAKVKKHVILTLRCNLDKEAWWMLNWIEVWPCELIVFSCFFLSPRSHMVKLPDAEEAISPDLGWFELRKQDLVERRVLQGVEPCFLTDEC